MNKHQLENRSLRIKRETKGPTLQKRAKSRRINEEYREASDSDHCDMTRTIALNNHKYDRKDKYQM